MKFIFRTKLHFPPRPEEGFIRNDIAKGVCYAASGYFMQNELGLLGPHKGYEELPKDFSRYALFCGRQRAYQESAERSTALMVFPGYLHVEFMIADRLRDGLLLKKRYVKRTLMDLLSLPSSEGVYEVLLTGGKFGGHSIVILKVDSWYLFDISFGFMRFDGSLVYGDARGIAEIKYFLEKHYPGVEEAYVFSVDPCRRLVKVNTVHSRVNTVFLRRLEMIYSSGAPHAPDKYISMERGLL